MITAKDIKLKLGITSQTLHNWRKGGKIVYERINCRNFLYDLDSLMGRHKESRKTVIYVRVSNTKQKEDLFRQEQVLRSYCVSNGVKVDDVFSDIASGMNEERKNFNKMMDLIIEGKIKKIIISYKDRLTRFGFGYFDKMFKKMGCEIEVLNSTDEKTYEEELTQDLISIIHHFSMKMYSSRRKKVKLALDALKSEND